MTDDQINFIKKKFGHFVSCSLECNPGWFNILCFLFFQIDSHLKETDSSASFKILQIKEKFGVLRVYSRGGDCTTNRLIAMAQGLSTVSCEICGSPGTLRGGSWLRTLCEHHAEEKKVPVYEDLFSFAVDQTIYLKGAQKEGAFVIKEIVSPSQIKGYFLSEEDSFGDKSPLRSFSKFNLGSFVQWVED